MDNKFKKNMNEVFDIAPVEVEAAIVKKTEENITISTQIETDYEYVRANLYTLIDKGQEAASGILELAQNTDHPRAYEVAATTIKSVADVAEKLIDLQKKMKDLKEEPKSSSPTTVNNTMFVGSTADLAKMLKDASKELEDK
jgi:hypothetical protein